MFANVICYGEGPKIKLMPAFWQTCAFVRNGLLLNYNFQIKNVSKKREDASMVREGSYINLTTTLVV